MYLSMFDAYVFLKLKRGARAPEVMCTQATKESSERRIDRSYWWLKRWRLCFRLCFPLVPLSEAAGLGLFSLLEFGVTV